MSKPPKLPSVNNATTAPVGNERNNRLVFNGVEYQGSGNKPAFYEYNQLGAELIGHISARQRFAWGDLYPFLMFSTAFANMLESCGKPQPLLSIFIGNN